MLIKHILVFEECTHSPPILRGQPGCLVRIKTRGFPNPPRDGGGLRA